MEAPTRTPRAPLAVLALLAASTAFLAAAPAKAQIKEPGAHPDYSVELEPHFVLQWTNDWFGSNGVGVGMRASVPVIQNGPIPKINNNFAIGFGLDWAHFSDPCWGGYGFYARPIDRRLPGYDCSAEDFWLPAVAQWNFFFTPVVSAYAELGLGIEYVTWSWDYPCPGGGGTCSYDDSDVQVEPFFAVGPRFLFGDTIGLILRIGTPYISIGASILL